MDLAERNYYIDLLRKYPTTLKLVQLKITPEELYEIVEEVSRDFLLVYDDSRKDEDILYIWNKARDRDRHPSDLTVYYVENFLEFKYAGRGMFNNIKDYDIVFYRQLLDGMSISNVNGDNEKENPLLIKLDDTLLDQYAKKKEESNGKNFASYVYAKWARIRNSLNEFVNKHSKEEVAKKIARGYAVLDYFKIPYTSGEVPHLLLSDLLKVTMNGDCVECLDDVYYMVDDYNIILNYCRKWFRDHRGIIVYDENDYRERVNVSKLDKWSNFMAREGGQYDDKKLYFLSIYSVIDLLVLLSEEVPTCFMTQVIIQDILGFDLSELTYVSIEDAQRYYMLSQGRATVLPGFIDDEIKGTYYMPNSNHVDDFDTYLEGKGVEKLDKDKMKLSKRLSSFIDPSIVLFAKKNVSNYDKVFDYIKDLVEVENVSDEDIINDLFKILGKKGSGDIDLSDIKELKIPRRQTLKFREDEE